MPKQSSKLTKLIIAYDDDNKENIPPPTSLSPIPKENPHFAAATAFLNEQFPLGPNPNIPTEQTITPENLIIHFDHHFPTYEHYCNFVDQHLKDWTCDPNFKAFDVAYCHHHLTITQAQKFQQISTSINTMIKDLNKTNQVQINNIKHLLPQLKSNGMFTQISQLLSKVVISPTR